MMFNGHTQYNIVNMLQQLDDHLQAPSASGLVPARWGMLLPYVGCLYQNVCALFVHVKPLIACAL